MTSRPLSPVTLSLVICTRNRAPQLALCLESLKQLRFADAWELIVVDNGSTDDTAARIKTFSTTASFVVKTLFEPTPGLGRARNRGWRAATGDIIAFTDDDCYPHATYFEEIVKTFAGKPQLGYIGGRIMLFDPTDYRITIQERDTHEDLPPKSFVPAGLIQGANISIRRTALESVNGFDDDFGAGAFFPSEDVEILARMSAVGWEGAYDPAAVVYHHHGRKTEAQAQKLMRQYDRGRGAYYAKNLLNPVIRHATLRYWFWHIRHQPWDVTKRELTAAIEFWWRWTIGKWWRKNP